MSNRMKLLFALLIQSLLLGGCMPFPGELPPLASAVTADHTPAA